MSEFGLLRFRTDPENSKHFGLQVGLMNSNAATADFDAV